LPPLAPAPSIFLLGADTTGDHTTDMRSTGAAVTPHPSGGNITTPKKIY